LIDGLPILEPQAIEWSLDGYIVPKAEPKVKAQRKAARQKK